MPGGKYDSSKTRVAPVFNHLKVLPCEWPRRLLELAEFGSPDSTIGGDMDLSFVEGAWGDKERGFRPPTALLEWLVRHPERWASEPGNDERRRLCAGDPDTLERALASVQSSGNHRRWFILEGYTYPDVFILTPSAVVVVEGKRTERGPTTHTKWMANRHQIWRHIDAAWEIRDRREVFGMFIVEGEGMSLPEQWRQAAKDSLSVDALRGSFPHRSPAEVAQLSRCFLGACTWHRVCESFGIDFSDLPDTISGLRT
jgi:hypothetical protein